MKKIFILLFFFIVMGVQAQKELTNFFPASNPSLSQAAKNTPMLIEGYVAPLANDLGSLINNGWYSTATTHNKFGFDLNVTMNSIFVKDENKSFSYPNLGGIVFDGTTSGKDRVPTIYGNENERPKFTYSSGPDAGRQFQGASGIQPGKDYGLKVMAIPTLQLGIGLIKKIDLHLRYTPQTKIDNVKSGNWGIGAMHDVKQYIPGIQSLPFSLSLFMAYTHLAGTIDLGGAYSGNGQEGKINGNAITGQILISKTLSFLTLYGALGYNQSKTVFAVKGTYTVDKLYPGGQSLTQSFNLTDPYSFDFKKSGVKATGGIRFRFGPATLHGDYTFYDGRGMLTAGVGASFK